MAVIKTTPNTTGTTGTSSRPPETTPVAKPPAAARTGIAARPAAGRVPQAAPKPSGAFLSDTQSELKKVVWPTRDTVQSGTIVTVLLLVVFGAYIFGLDAIIAKVFDSLNLYGTASVAR